MTSKLHVNITDKTRAALESLVEREGTSMTDQVNRAIQLYDFLTSQVVNGKTLQLVGDNETMTVHYG